jgi:hypothetical protein
MREKKKIVNGIFYLKFYKELFFLNSLDKNVFFFYFFR